MRSRVYEAREFQNQKFRNDRWSNGGKKSESCCPGTAHKWIKGLYKGCLCVVQLVITIHKQALFSNEHNEKIQMCESNEHKLGHQLINRENLG